MSVLIRGMKMPSSCFDCPISHPAYSKTIGCGVTGKTIPAPDCEGKLMADCPLAEIPAQHGRLIDEKALTKDLEKRWNVNDDHDFCNKEVWHALREAPTIIEAEAGNRKRKVCDG